MKMCQKMHLCDDKKNDIDTKFQLNKHCSFKEVLSK